MDGSFCAEMPSNRLKQCLAKTVELNTELKTFI